jgi:hypothetical protein
VQLSGELAKVNIANLLQLVKTGGLTGKLTFSQGARTATIFIHLGLPIHAECEGEEGVEGLMELFLWTSGTFSFNEEALDGVPWSIDKDDPDQSFERLLKDGISYQEAKHYLDVFEITPKSILKPTGTAVSFAKQILAMPGLERLDGKQTIAEALADMNLTKREYVKTISSWLLDGVADIAEPILLEDMNGVDLPSWVVSRLKQDNPDISQAIVDMVIWVDRVKCWMFQVDVDFYKLRKHIEQSTGGTGDLDDYDNDGDYGDDNLFGPPAPPPSSQDIYSPVSFGGEQSNIWRPPNYYQGGSLFKSSVLDNVDNETPAGGSGARGAGSPGTDPQKKKQSDTDSSKGSKSIEF